MVISGQQMADTVNYARRFSLVLGYTQVGGWWCPTLAKKSIEERTDFFGRLYYYNCLSYDIKYEENCDIAREIEDCARYFSNLALVLTFKIDFLQFMTNLRFLLYNIEKDEIEDALKAFDEEHESHEYDRLQEDYALLEKIYSELCRSYVMAQCDMIDTRWAYDD